MYTVGARFVWDVRKSELNLEERGFDFEFATQVFDSPTLERTDNRRDYGEQRVIALGLAQDVPLTVVYTDRAESGGAFVRRIISASPRVIKAARLLAPSARPSAIPAAIANTFLTAPPTATPTISSVR